MVVSFLLKHLALWAIRGYQRFISPYKGFHCAYKITTGCASCSVLGYRVVRRFGLFSGIILIRQRFKRCSQAYQTQFNLNNHINNTLNRSYRRYKPHRLQFQSGECDVGGCDGLDILNDYAICANCADCGNCGDCYITRKDIKACFSGFKKRVRQCF